MKRCGIPDKFPCPLVIWGLLLWIGNLLNVVNSSPWFVSGYYEGSFGTEHPCKYGWWSIVVQGWVSHALIAYCKSING